MTAPSSPSLPANAAAATTAADTADTADTAASPAEPLRIVLCGDTVLPNEFRLERKADFAYTVARLPTRTSNEDKAAALHHADAVVCLTFDQPSRDAPRLRLVQTQSAGVERVRLDYLPDQATLCNAFGHTQAIAEYVLMTMLMWTHQFKAVEASFRSGSWLYSGAQYGPLRDELNVKTVGIVGLGQLGQAIARQVSGIGARVLGCARRPLPVDGVTKVYGLDRLDDFLGQCDFVVLAVALAPGTEGLIDAARLARMKPDAVLVNVARGPVVVEADLYTALKVGAIGGAILDVWWRYPTADEPGRKPSTFNFAGLPNVFMTPHSSGWTEQMMDRRWDMIIGNLGALARGEPLRNVVRPPVTA